MKDLYKILELEKNASMKEIKKAYKLKAMKTHPDKGGDENKFKEISEAYSILSDEKKRYDYDKYGYDYINNDQINISPFDIFNNLFQETNIFEGNNLFDMMNPFKNNTQTLYELHVTLDEIHSGIEKKITVNRNVMCDKCNGIGHDLGKIFKCNECDGEGYKINIREGPLPGMIQQMSSPCLNCNSKGFCCEENSECKICTNGLIKKKNKYKINIKSGSSNNQIILQNKGDYNKETKKYNDLIINIKEVKHTEYTRKENDLYTTKSIHLKDALLGCIYPLEFLNKKMIYLNINKVIKPNLLIKVPGYGIQSNKSYGDLIINFNVLFPNDIVNQYISDLPSNLKEVNNVDLVNIEYYNHSI